MLGLSHSSGINWLRLVYIWATAARFVTKTSHCNLVSTLGKTTMLALRSNWLWLPWKIIPEAGQATFGSLLHSCTAGIATVIFVRPRLQPSLLYDLPAM